MGSTKLGSQPDAQPSLAEITRLRDALRKMRTLYNVTRILTVTRDPQDALSLILDEVMAVTGATSGSIALVRPEDQALVIAVSRGLLADEITGFVLPSGSGITGWVAANGSSLLVPDVRAETRYVQIDERVRSELAVPIVRDDRVLGVINVDHTRLGAFGRDDLEMLEAVAVQAAAVLEVARLFRALDERTRDLERQAVELREANAALERARLAAEEGTRAKADFLANMSHEIRTPLNAVIGMTSLLVDSALDDEQRDYVHTVRVSGEHLLAIINDILDFSKIEAGKLELEQSPFELRTCLEDCLELVSVQAARKGLELAFELDPSCPESIWGDAGRFRQVVVNLLSNAVKFTAVGEVVLGASAPAIAPGEHRIHVWVQDTGIGIPADRLDRLFQSFSQVDSSTTRRFGGTGLGLAIARRLAELMGGRLWVESEEGRGSTFHLELCAADAGPRRRTAFADQPGALAGLRTLVVDDNEVNRRIVEGYVRSWGMIARSAASAEATLEWLRRGEDFDVVITDYHMPGGDGLELAASIRALGLPDPPRVVLLSSAGGGQSDVPARRAVVDGVLTKPIKPMALFELLFELLVVDGSSRAPNAPVAPAIDSGLGSRHPLRVLVAEDNPVNQKVALALLARLGYRADVAGNGREALAALERQRYDVLLLDVHMPVLDGLATAEEACRRWPVHERPRMIAMTADAMEGDRERCLDAGMSDYVSKPVRIEELADALTRSVARDLGASAPPHAHIAEPAEGDAVWPDDLALLRESVGDEAFEAIVADYVESSLGWFSDLDAAIRAADTARARMLAHDLKSTSKTVGARRAATIAREIEERARDGSLDGVPPLVAGLYEALVTARGALAAHHRHLPPPR